MKRLFSFLFFVFLTSSSFAQHCPFDGGTAIVVRLTNATGETIKDSSFSIFLSEVDNPKADSCSYAEGLLQRSFGSVENALVKKYTGAWTIWAEERIVECSFYNIPGHYAYVLSQAEESCMIKKNNDYNYIKRKYEVHIKKGGKVIQTAPLFAKDKYKLCTGAGSWNRIEPLVIVLNE